MTLKSLPAAVADLYPMSSNDWVRQFPWTHATGRRDHFETVYGRIVFPAGATNPVEQKVRVAVPRSIFYNSHAAVWDIALQIRHAQAVRGRASKLYRKAGRR